jgi:hypothetical protein
MDNIDRHTFNKKISALDFSHRIVMLTLSTVFYSKMHAHFRNIGSHNYLGYVATSDIVKGMSHNVYSADQIRDRLNHLVEEGLVVKTMQRHHLARRRLCWRPTFIKSELYSLEKEHNIIINP